LKKEKNTIKLKRKDEKNEIHNFNYLF